MKAILSHKKVFLKRGKSKSKHYPKKRNFVLSNFVY